MIRSTVWRDKQGRIRRFHVTGHAEAAEYGEDIICAAVSVLVTNAINSSEKLLGVHIADDPDIAPGDVKVDIPTLPSLLDEKLQLLFEAMVYGIQQVAESYPDFVRIFAKPL
ncbi:MAG TPA: ribosomal-processing cysteine protease Prp [Bacilli bacterium]|nr:ribosomal-processing cysteine protease Prp [Bacilli bacterium]